MMHDGNNALTIGSYGIIARVPDQPWGHINRRIRLLRMENDEQIFKHMMQTLILTSDLDFLRTGNFYEGLFFQVFSTGFNGMIDKDQSCPTSIQKYIV